MSCYMRLVMFDITVYSEILKHVGQTRTLENQDPPLVNIYVKELLDGFGPVQIVIENTIALVEVTVGIFAECVE